MSKVAVFIEHRVLPAKRANVHRVWDAYLRPHIARNAAHEAYFYCFDSSDPDVIRAFQQYSSGAEAQAFLASPGYADYVAAVTPLLTGQPKVRTLTPVWSKAALP